MVVTLLQDLTALEALGRKGQVATIQGSAWHNLLILSLEIVTGHDVTAYTHTYLVYLIKLLAKLLKSPTTFFCVSHALLL